MYRAHTQRREIGVRLYDFRTCISHRARIRLPVGISARISASTQAKRTANTLNLPDEEQVQESMGGLDWSMHFSGAAVKKVNE